jgi:hypothetical protein
MNYIRHLTTFYEKLALDNRLNPNHVSLYLALFQCWNMNLFVNPISVNRAQALQFCKIGSLHTYYKALKDLRDWGYIQYEASSSTAKGALVSMCIFVSESSDSPLSKNDGSLDAIMHLDEPKGDISNDANMHQCNNATGSDAKMHQDETKVSLNKDADMHQCNIATSSDAKMHPLSNEKTVCEQTSQTIIQKTEIMNTTNQPVNANPGSKKGARRKENTMEPPTILSVTTYFHIEEFPEVEAHKFFNHYQSNGWKVGGKAPMKDWHAAARNWMLNSHNFKQSSRPGPYSRQQNNTKNYGEPL